MDSDKMIEVHCDKVELRPELGWKIFVVFSLDYTVREILDLGDGDLHTVREDPLDATKCYETYLSPNADIYSTLRDRFEIGDDVSEALASCISSVLEDYCSEGVGMELGVKVVQDIVFKPEDYYDDVDDDEHGSCPFDVCEDGDTLKLPEISDSTVEMEDYVVEEEEDIDDVCDEWVPSGVSEAHDDLVLSENSDYLLDLEEEQGLGMWDLDMDTDNDDVEKEEEEEIARETGAPKHDHKP